jgi:hypothetical protein
MDDYVTKPVNAAMLLDNPAQIAAIAPKPDRRPNPR